MSQRTTGGYRGRGRPGPYRRDRPKFWKHQDEANDRQYNEQESIVKLEDGFVDDVNVTPQRSTGESMVAVGESGNGDSNDGPSGSAKKEKKFSNKARLFVGNLPRDMTDSEVKKLFETYGEVREVFLQKDRNFGFVRMAYRGEAERAIACLNGMMLKGRDMKVRFAASSCSVKVTNIGPMVSNELLAEAFSLFGEVENAVVVTDERGKSLGYGIVDFARKANATSAIQRCKNDHFLLTRSPVPVIVSELNRDNEDEGLPEKALVKNAAYYEERELPPRFASPNSLEYALAARWKQTIEDEKVLREELEHRLKQAKSDIINESEAIKEQFRTNILREELARNQQENLRIMEQLRQRGEPLPSLMGPLAGPTPPLHSNVPPPALLQHPLQGQQIPPPLFSSPGNEMKPEPRVPLEPPGMDEYLYGNPRGGAPPSFVNPTPLLGQKFH